MKIKSFGFSRITTEQLEIAVNSLHIAGEYFDCAMAGFLCGDCPFFSPGQDCSVEEIDSEMWQLAIAELKRRDEEC